MDAEPPPSAARLRIHLDLGAQARDRGLRAALRRLRSLIAADPRALWRTPFGLRIDDSGGKEVFAIDDAGPLLNMQLPPGRYQVTARFRNLLRSYTLTLAQGETFDLHLRF